MTDNKRTKRHTSKQLDKFQKIIRVKFTNKSLLKTALTHRSYVNEAEGFVQDNERLEYLGDSVLALIVNEYLFKHYGNYEEGELAKIKSAVVSEVTLAQVAEEIDLGSFLLMGKGEENSGGRQRTSILANSVESVIGAIYLDSGLKVSKKFVLRILKKHIDRIDHTSYLRDPKTTLQEFVQKRFKEQPVYQLIEENGPDHLKIFKIKLLIHGQEIIIATGSSKRKAEMEAARLALIKIHQGDGEL